MKLIENASKCWKMFSIYKNGVAIVVNSSVGSDGVPLAPAVIMDAAVGLSVQMLATPQYSIPAGFTYWD